MQKLQLLKIHNLLTSERCVYSGNTVILKIQNISITTKDFFDLSMESLIPSNLSIQYHDKDIIIIQASVLQVFVWMFGFISLG